MLYNNLYFEKRLTRVTYTDNPGSGDLDVDRLLSKESAFRDEERLTTLKPKTILLSGLDLYAWPDHHVKAFILRLSLLEKSGFQIYSGTGQQLRCSDYDNLIDVDLKAIKTVTKLDVPADELFVFDEDFAYRFMLGDEGDCEPFIGKSDINLTVPISFDSLIKLLESNQSYLTSLDLSCFYNLQEKNVDLNALPALPNLEMLKVDSQRYRLQLNDVFVDLLGKICSLSPKLSKLTFPNDRLLDYLSSSEKITELTLPQTEMTPRLLDFLRKQQDIKKLSLPKVSHTDELDQILDQNPFLEELTLASVQNIESLEKLLNRGFKKLKLFNCDHLQDLDKLNTLHFYDQKLDINMLHALLLKTNNLKKLTLSFCNNLQGYFPEDLNLAQLEEIKLNKFNMNMQAVHALLCATKNLIKLELCGSSIIQFPEMTDVNLEYLEILDLSWSTIDTPTLGHFLSQIKRLKYLNLSGCRFLNSDLKLPESLNLEQLEYIDVSGSGSGSGSKINSDQLYTLLTYAKHLKKLNLKELDLKKFQVDLRELQILELSQSNISGQTLFSLLSQAKHLKKLDLENCNIGPELENFSIKLEALEEIKITNFSFDAKLLSTLLEPAKNLKKIELNIHDIQDFNFSNIDAAQLEILSLYNANFNHHHLNAFLVKAKKLINFCISGPVCQEVDLSKVNVTRLEVLGIDSSCSLEQLSMLLYRAPKLKSIGFTYYGLRDQNEERFLETLNFFSMDEIVIQIMEQISAQNLCRLIKTCKAGAFSLYAPMENISDFESLDYYMDMYDLSPEQKKIIQQSIGIQVLSSQSLSLLEDSVIQSSSSSGKKHASLESVDANTAFKKTTFSLKRTFLGKPHTPSPSQIRQTIFDNFRLNSQSLGMKNPFILMPSAINEKDLIPLTAACVNDSIYPRYQQQGDGHYFFRDTLTLDHEWQALPSLFFDERLEVYHVEPNVEVEIRRNTQLGMYFIRLPQHIISPQEVTLELLLSHTPESSSLINNLPPEIYELIQNCRDFKDTQLTDIDIDATAKVYLDALIQQRKGACRHRAIAFKYLMERDYPDIPVRIISNDCHMYVEVNYNNQWIKTDLGGYAANLEVDESNFPQNSSISEMSNSNGEDISNQFECTLSAQSDNTITIDNVRNLITLTLEEGAAFPMTPLPFLGTLIFNNYSLTAEQLHSILQYTPNLKTLNLLNCRMTSEEFEKIDLSCLNKLEQVQLKVDTPFPFQTLQTVMRTTSPLTEWHIESDELVSEVTEIPSSRIHITQPKRKPIPHRYFPSRKEHTDLHKQLWSLLQSQEKSTLVDTVNPEAIRLAVNDMALKTGRPCYYIHTPEELRIAESHLKRTGLVGEVVKTRGGALYDFLTTSHQERPIILINFDTFKSDDIVRCNTILDEIPSIDNVSIPSNCHIIGLYNRSSPSAYTGSDFISRFDAEMVFKHSDFEVPAPSLELSEVATKNVSVIDFSGEIGWEKIISGHWHLEKNKWRFEEGALLQAIRAGKREFIFNNAPIDNPAFRRFWHDLTLHQGLYHRGELFASLPSDFQIYFTNQAPIYSDVFKAHTESTLYTPSFLINSTCKSAMFNTINDDAGEVLFDTGLIEQFSGNTLSVYLTTSLPPDLWLKLYQQCKLHNTILNISCAPNVRIPSTILAETPTPIVLPTVTHTQLKTKIPTITTEDEAEIIDISEVLASELISYSKASFDLDTDGFKCTLVEGYLDKALASGKTVILKGVWSESLASALHPLLFKRAQEVNVSGKLIVVCDKPALFSSLNVVSSEVVREEERSVIYEQAQYSERFQKVEDILKNEPTVLLSGATGIGKTHFITNQWKKVYPQCHYGEEHLLDWVKDDQPGLKTLFIDEANITDKQWTIFEGLYQTPPALFYQGNYYKLTPEHKVIFAGNPLSYGGERELPAFFSKHQCQINFYPLPMDVFKENLGLDEDIVGPVLEMIDYVTHLDANDTLLTPREILMIAYLTRVFIEQYPANKHQISQHFAYEICKQYIPKWSLGEFKEKFQPLETLPYPAISLPNFVVNPRNAEPIQALYAHLQLRNARLQPNTAVPSTGGLGGLVLEGSPGIGKSAMVKEIFTALDLKEHHDFIYLPVKLSQKQKERALIDAFHQGQIVMIDEINSSPMLERLLNALLEGHDLNGNSAKKPGFMLVGTQNPITLSGRVQTTLPLKHRLQTIKIEDYTYEDMLGILKHMQIPNRIAKDMLEEMKLNPSLCFRDVQKTAKRWKENPIHQKEIQIKLEALPQLGSLCKTVAVANVENFYAQKLGYKPIPLRSNSTDSPSIRKLSKNNGSAQGEILEFNQWERTLNDLGFETESIDVNDDFHLFLETIVTNLKNGNLPLIAFSVQPDTGVANPEPLEPETTEHGAVITGYNPSTDKISIVQWGESYVLNATDLFHSSNALVETRTPEYYRKNPLYDKSKKMTVEKYIPTTPEHAERFSITPTKGSGFKAKLLIVKQPNNVEELMLRRKNVQKPSKLDFTHRFWSTTNSQHSISKRKPFIPKNPSLGPKH